MSAKKENAMTLKSQLVDHVAGVVSQIEQRAEELPGQVQGQVDDVKETLSDWSDRGRSFVRKNPGVAIVGAFAVGYLLARLARHA